MEIFCSCKPTLKFKQLGLLVLDSKLWETELSFLAWVLLRLCIFLLHLQVNSKLPQKTRPFAGLSCSLFSQRNNVVSAAYHGEVRLVLFSARCPISLQSTRATSDRFRQRCYTLLPSGVRRIFQWRRVSVTSHRDDVSFGDVTAIIMP